METDKVTFLDEILHEPVAMLQYIDLLDDHRAGIIRTLHTEWLELLIEYRNYEYQWLTSHRILPHVRAHTKNKNKKKGTVVEK
jgi:hypothetical protein